MTEAATDPWREVKYPNFGNRTAAEIPEWADDSSWPVRYTHYAEALRLAAEVNHARFLDEADRALELLEALGDPILSIWDGLDTSRRTLVGQGEFLLDEVILPALECLLSEFTPHELITDAQGVQSLVAWQVWFIAPTPTRRRESLRRYLPDNAPDDTEAFLAQRRWSLGLRELEIPRRINSALLPSLDQPTAQGLRALTCAIDDRLAGESWEEEDFTDASPFDGIVPSDLSKVLAERAKGLREYRDALRAKDLHVDGIDDRGLTDLLAGALPRLRTKIHAGQSQLLIGPTSTGKSDFGRIAAAHVVSRKRKVIVLLPTKALVAQTSEDWRSFFQTADSSTDWRIVEASRDHPYNDEVIAKGDFDIALAIPEKLAAYVAAGSRILDHCGLLIVDELQFIGQRQRGVNIESLLTVIKSRYPHLPIIALSATLSAESSASLQTWLGVDIPGSSGLVASESRPVALDRFACSETEWMCRTAQGERTAGEWDLSISDPELRKRLDRELPSGQAVYRNTVTLVSTLLSRQDAHTERKSVLVFVGSRRAAERMTGAIQVALEFSNLNDPSSRRSPHWGRFGRQVLTEEEAAERDAEFFRLPNLRATDDLREGLQTGVMYHSARLDPDHRRVIERAYHDKVIRVIVATATLAVGMNLPADFVVVADVTEGVGGFEDNLAVQRLLDPHDMAQRFGRCGRLGMSTKGEAYVMVPRAGPRPVRLRLTNDQRARILGTSTQDARVGTTDETASFFTALADVGRSFEYFVETADTGEEIRSNLDVPGFARLVLQDMCRGTPALSRADLELRAKGIYETSLLKAEGGTRPAIDAILETLETDSLIGPSPDDPSRWKVSGLGRTLALSNLSVGNARCIRKVAEAAELGAGPLTLLSIAAEADFVRELTWISLPHDSNADLVDHVRRNCWLFVKSFVEGPDRAGSMSFGAVVDQVILENDLIGSGNPAQSVRGRVEMEVDRVRDVVIVGLLRSCIAYLWMIGYPMNSILSLVMKGTGATVRRRSRSIELYPADVRDLGERMSYILNAAAEVLRVAPQDGRHLVLKNMSEALQSGLPYQLAPLLRIRTPRIHRERLATLLDMRADELNFDELEGALDRLSQPRPERTAQEQRAHQNLAFTSAERADIIRHLTRPEERRGARGLPPDLREEMIPSRRATEGSVSYGKLADDLARRLSAELRLDDLAFVFEEFGLEVVTSGPGRLILSRSGFPPPVEVVLVDERLDSGGLEGYRGENRVLVVFGGLSIGAEFALRASTTAGFSTMTGPVLLSALARIDRHWRASYRGPDPDGELARRVLRFVQTAMGPIGLSDVSLAEVADALPAPPPLFVG